MKIYRVKNWEEHFENNRTRTMEIMRWVPIPNKHDGDGYTEMVSGPDGAAIYGCWVAVIQVSSKCHPRGTLLRANETAHDAASLSRITRLPEELIQKALDKASSPSVGWLDVIEAPEPHTVAQACQVPDTKTQVPDTKMSGRCGQTTMEGNGIEGREGKGTPLSPPGGVGRAKQGTLTLPNPGQEPDPNEIVAIPKTPKAPTPEELAVIESIYELYPRKADKPNALTAIRRLLKTHNADFLRERTAAFALAVQGTNTLLPNPATWFNGHRFNDDATTWVSQLGQNGKHRIIADHSKGF